MARNDLNTGLPYLAQFGTNLMDTLTKAYMNKLEREQGAKAKEKEFEQQLKLKQIEPIIEGVTKGTMTATLPRLSPELMQPEQSGVSAVSEAIKSNRLGELKTTPITKEKGAKWMFDVASKKFTNPYTGEERVVIPEGDTYSVMVAEKGLGDVGGRLAMLQVAENQIPEVKALLFDNNGKLKPWVIAGSKIAGGIGEEARLYNSKMNDIVEAKLRAETGAAATTDEVNRIAQRYKAMPILDNEKTVLDKMERLSDFVKYAKISIDPSGRFTERYEGKRDDGSEPKLADPLGIR